MSSHGPTVARVFAVVKYVVVVGGVVLVAFSSPPVQYLGLVLFLASAVYVVARPLLRRSWAESIAEQDAVERPAGEDAEAGDENRTHADHELAKTYKLEELRSVRQAHDVATSLNRVGGKSMARVVLLQIFEGDLPGGANDFHNAAVEATMSDDPRLALRIIERGLEMYPDQFDLVADRARALTVMGRAVEAKESLEAFHRRKPYEFRRSWRPLLFYIDAVRAGEATPEAIASVREAFLGVVAQNPQQVKTWSAFARFQIEFGQMEDSERTLHDALTHNPFSQELNYVLGELLLRQGRAEDAVTYLENALRVDYQEQFQHDVNQYAVRGTLGQAYEAAGQFDHAKRIYESIASSDDPEAYYHLKRFAANRVEAIGNLATERTEASAVDDTLRDILNKILSDVRAYRRQPSTSKIVDLDYEQASTLELFRQALQGNQEADE